MAPLLLLTLLVLGCSAPTPRTPPSPPPARDQVGVQGVGPPVGAALVAICSSYEPCRRPRVGRLPRVLAPSGGFVLVSVPARAGTVYGVVRVGRRILRAGNAELRDRTRTRWRVRMPVGIPAGAVLDLRVSPLRTDSGGMVLRVRLMPVREIL